jgi:hypothetical protein
MVSVADEGPIRQTEEGALAYAAQIGARVEIAAYRTETLSVFANPDGTLTDVEHAQPVRVIRAGRWVEAAAILVPAPGGTFAPKAAAFGLRLSGGGTGPLVTAERAGRSMSLTWPGELPPPEVVGEQAKYAEVLPGVDLVVNVSVTDFSHVLVIKNAEAARNPKLAEVEFGLRTEGLTVRRTDAGGVEAVDEAAGGAVFEAPTPIMWDSGEPAAAPGPVSAQARVPGVASVPSEKAPQSAQHAPRQPTLGAALPPPRAPA